MDFYNNRQQGILLLPEQELRHVVRNYSTYPCYTRLASLDFPRFNGDGICEDPMTELMRLSQKGSMTEFHEQFDAIVSRVELAGEHQLSCLLGGLRQDVQMLVRMFQPFNYEAFF
ncbi:hypothetical protein HKD37_01G001921 [Glycine soja]